MERSTYDYIIVGAGSAGCALADRLSRDGRHSVLVIEAGGTDKRFWIKVPVGYGVNFANPRLNWGYHAEPDAALGGRSIYWPRGKVIGGSSSINAMAYMRGLPQDFDGWVQQGAAGWSWDAVRPAFERMERHIERDASGAVVERGDGPVCISNLQDQMNPFSKRFLAASEECGWAHSDNISAATTEGMGYYRSTVRNGFRWSAADAFLVPARRRANVRVVSQATVHRIMLQGRRAAGVIYERRGATVTAHAAREVILSAGAVNSPKLLQLSGIGPADVLQQHGIEVQHALAQVGKGLQDHVAISHLFRATAPTLNNILGRALPRLWAGMRYLGTRRGPLSVPVNQVGGFVRSGPDRDTPDLQIYCNPVSYWMSPEGNPVLDHEPGFLLCAQVCRPESRGEINIRSSDPHDAPVIHANSLTTEYDREGARRSLEIISRLAAAPSLANVVRERLVPEKGLTNADDLMQDFRARASTVFHPTSTCRMGSDATDSVLDSRLRVHGIAGLRVVDSSAFPSVTSGNTNAPTMMLAMRAADMILDDAVMDQNDRELTYAP